MKNLPKLVLWVVGVYLGVMLITGLAILSAAALWFAQF